MTGHGVDPDLIDEMLVVTTAFFDLPVEDKMACYLPDRALNRGYAPARCAAVRSRPMLYASNRSLGRSRSPSE